MYVNETNFEGFRQGHTKNEEYAPCWSLSESLLPLSDLSEAGVSSGNGIGCNVVRFSPSFSCTWIICANLKWPTFVHISYYRTSKYCQGWTLEIHDELIQNPSRHSKCFRITAKAWSFVLLDCVTGSKVRLTEENKNIFIVVLVVLLFRFFSKHTIFIFGSSLEK